MKGFLDFVREQGVVGLAVGFILGGAVAGVVSALVDDLIDPIIGLALGSAEGLANASFKVADATVAYGHFFSVLLDFAIVALVVYAGVKMLKLDRLDKKKE